MLPDYPKAKRAVADEHMRLFIRIRKKALGVLGAMPTATVHEGRNVLLARRTGPTEVIERKLLSSQIAITGDELMRPDAVTIVQERISECAIDMADQQGRQFFRSLSALCERTGQTTDHKGKRLDVDALIANYDMVQIDFDSNGQPRLPQIHAGSVAAEAIERVFKEVSQSAEQQLKWTSLLERKYLEWRDRESSRRLVG